jgi:hypothetical protein
MLNKPMIQDHRHTPNRIPRRQALQRAACGFGHLALLGMMNSVGRAAESGRDASSLEHGTLAVRAPHFTPRAKRVIFLFLHGGVSHVDSFDPKPKLDEWHGKKIPGAIPLSFDNLDGTLMKSPWDFKRYGKSGLPVSDLWPHIGSVVDEIAFLRSMHVEQVDHGGAVLQLHTGSAVFPRPSMGSWLVYGLGTENANMPGFITISPQLYHGSSQNYSSSFLPAEYQGTPFGETNTPAKIAKFHNLRPANPRTELQRLQLDFARRANQRHLESVNDDPRLQARIEAYQLAFRMQTSAPETTDISREPRDVLDLYGVDRSGTDDFGRQCLLARRFAERGVRFIQCSHSYKWDQHGQLRGGHARNASEVDKPIAGLIVDLKQRGMLEDTLVIWGTEFGRTPITQGKLEDKDAVGRDHNPYGFTMWMAGGGVKGGMAYGGTDEFGYFAEEKPVSMYDFHATVLRLLGLDHTRLTYRYSGRDFRLTDVFGRVIEDIIA